MDVDSFMGLPAPPRRPSATVSQAPSIKDVPIESASSLGMDVMNALHSDQQVMLEFGPISPRVLLSSSRISDTSHSSFSSHDPPSTAHEPRISISSTIYPSSTYDSLPSPITHLHPSSLSYTIDRPTSSRPTKPALPTTPKPDFRRSRSAQPASNSPIISKPPSPSSPRLSGLIPYHLLTSHTHPSQSLPPTTNYLNLHERADLIRKTRKLTQVLGQTPSPIAEPGDYPVLNNCLLPLMPSRQMHARGAMPVSDASNISDAVKGLRSQCASTIAAERTDSLSPITFRSSYHFSQGDDSDDSMSSFESPAAQTPMSSKKKGDDVSIKSPTITSASKSFIELSEPGYHGGLIRFPSDYSLTDSINDAQQAEEERRRKRERLAKLHRFLGSRVPAELILGPHEMGEPLPAPDPFQAGSTCTLSDGETSSPAKLWIRGKRRNSLASADPLERLADTERMKEDLSNREKAIIVKRALKMERMFGEQPPQDLFRTTYAHSGNRATGKSKQTKSAPSSPVGGNINRSAYRKGKHSKQPRRPGTAESQKELLGPGGAAAGDFGMLELSNVYLHYRSSLISLTNIVDNDDRKSLVELHEYINEEPSNVRREKPDKDSYSSIRSERRRSLPLRTSCTSLSSQFTITEAKVNITPFEVRRRRAAKLSHFFGVSYRDLFGEVLDSIEMGVREDEGKGTLNADEAKDLLAQLTMLKKRRDEFS